MARDPGGLGDTLHLHMIARKLPVHHRLRTSVCVAPRQHALRAVGSVTWSPESSAPVLDCKICVLLKPRKRSGSDIDYCSCRDRLWKISALLHELGLPASQATGSHAEGDTRRGPRSVGVSRLTYARASLLLHLARPASAKIKIFDPHRRTRQGVCQTSSSARVTGCSSRIRLTTLGYPSAKTNMAGPRSRNSRKDPAWLPINSRAGRKNRNVPSRA